MRTVVVGDSYARTFHNTWIEKIFNTFNLELIHHQGTDGGCEFFIYENFKRSVRAYNVDLCIFVHTEPGRLVNMMKLGITPVLVTQVPHDQTNLPLEVYTAAKGYYENIYYKPFHTWIQHSLIKEMQQTCVEKKIRQIHIPAFHYPDTPMNNGLWINGGLFQLSQRENVYVPGTIDKRKNHFSENLHDKFSKWLIPHVDYYLNKRKIDDLHVVLMDPDEVDRCK